jgi:hypothetical protein
MLAQHCGLYEVNDLARSIGLAFFTHLPHGTFRSHLCLSLRRTVSAAGVEFAIGCDSMAYLRHSAHAPPGRHVALVAMVAIEACDVEVDQNVNVGSGGVKESTDTIGVQAMNRSGLKL